MKKSIVYFILILSTIVEFAKASTGPNLVGLTGNGGTYGGGTIIKYTGGDTVINSYYSLPVNSYPFTGLVEACNGKLYGLTYDGDSGNVLFEYDYVADTFHIWVNGGITINQSTILIQATDGKLYGVNFGGDLYSYTIGEDSIHTLYNIFHTSSRFSSLIQSKNGKLYGMTANDGINDGGRIYEYDLIANTYTQVYSLPANADPTGALIETDTGKFYGFTRGDGTDSSGTIFNYDLNSSTYTVLYNFQGGDSLAPQASPIIASNRKIYGTLGTLNYQNGYFGGNRSAAGNLFSFDLTTNTYTDIHDFSNQGNSEYDPNCTLFQASDGMLYGATLGGGGGGGGYGYGAIFRYDINTSTYTEELDFDITNGGPGFFYYGPFIEYKYPPVITSPINQSICNGNPVSIVATSDSIPISLQWQVSTDGGNSYSNIPNATSDTLTFTANTAQNGNMYRAIFSFNCASQTTTAALLNVAPTPAPVISNNGNSTLSTGNYTSYQWLRNGNPIAGATSQNLTITQEGTYSVFVIDSNGCSDTSAVVEIKTVGINAISDDDNVSLYPNPNNGSFILKSSSIGKEFMIYDMIGSKITQQIISTNNQLVQLEDIPSGTYILLIKGNSRPVRFAIVK